MNASAELVSESVNASPYLALLKILEKDSDSLGSSVSIRAILARYSAGVSAAASPNPDASQAFRSKA